VEMRQQTREQSAQQESEGVLSVSDKVLLHRDRRERHPKGRNKPQRRTEAAKEMKFPETRIDENKQEGIS
jgi:hypothetical protein